MTGNEMSSPTAREGPATDVGTLAGLLHETAVRHDAFEKATPPHDWWDWYAPYLAARLQGTSADEATAAADLYMREVHGVQPETSPATPEPEVGTIPMRFEVTTLPVADVDRAKAFYQRIGWRLDIDFNPTPDSRGVQFTPPGSAASIQFGSGRGEPMTERLERLLLIVDDIQAAREDLIGRGVEVGEIFHNEPGKGPAPGIDPERRSYASLAAFTDPDGNQWLLQEVTERLPGRV